MSKTDNEKKDRIVEVKVNVTNIVKYVCIAGVFIVAIIFGAGCLAKYFEEDN